MLYRKNFEILRGVKAFVMLFEQILIKLIAPHSEFFTKYDAFCSHISIYACLLQARNGSEKFGWGPGGCNFELG